MNINEKAGVGLKFSIISKRVTGHLSAFEEFCKAKINFSDNSPQKIFYGDGMVFLKSSPGEWLEFKLFERKFRVEAGYWSDYTMGFLYTYEIVPGNDRSKRKYHRLDDVAIVVIPDGSMSTYSIPNQTVQAKNQSGQKYEIPLSSRNVPTLKEDYIDLLWETCFEPLLRK